MAEKFLMIHIVFRKRLDLENAWGVLRYGVLVCQDCKLVHIALEHQRKQTVIIDKLLFITISFETLTVLRTFSFKF